MARKGYIMTQEHKDKISAANKGRKQPWADNPHGFKKGDTPWNKGLSITLSDNLKDWRANGGESWNKGLSGVDNPLTGRKNSEEARRRMSDKAKERVISGKCNFWRGGVHKKNATERHIVMSSFEYKQWRRLVYERDNYTCQICNKRGGILHADHIKPFLKFPELRTELSNGRTVCAQCHYKTDTFGSKTNLRSAN